MGGFEGVCGGFERCSLLQKPCAAATDRRQRVSSDSVWTDRGGYGRRRRKQPSDDRPVVFMRGTEEDKCCQLRLYIYLLSVSLFTLLMERQSPPHSSARLTTTCVAWRGRELGIINLTTSLTAH